ncbi:MAG: tetratricopeptide repeat protein [Burkholderiaceae bacterium]|nr:tetratricopeptide repeat protein [Burkholderiaceae bacterium]
MSLINQMLQDLDKRGAEPHSAGTLAQAIQVNKTTSASQKLIAIGIVIALVIGGILLWQQRNGSTLLNQSTLKKAENSARVAASTTNAPVPVVAPSAASAVTSNMPKTDVAQSSEANAIDVAEIPSAQSLSLGLKLSTAVDPERWTRAAEKDQSKRVGTEIESSLVRENAQHDRGAKNTPDQASRIDRVTANEKNQAATLVEKSPSTPTSPTTTSEVNTTSAGTKASKANKENTSSESNQTSLISNAQAKLIKETTPQQKAESEYRQATQFQQQGRIAEAIQSLEQALKSDPQHTAAFQLLIALFLESKRHDEAMVWLQRSLQNDISQPGLAMVLARLQVEKKQQTSAIETLQKSLLAAAERPDYWAFLAALLQRESRHAEAAEMYARATKKNPQNGVWWMGMGISLQAENRRSEALDAFVHAKSATGLSAELVAFVEQKISLLERELRR